MPNLCITCGVPIAEDRQICKECETKFQKDYEMTLEDSINYFGKVLRWDEFCKAHRPFAKAIKVILEHYKMMKVLLDNNAKMPTKAHEDDAGFDIYAREEKLVPAKGSAIFDIGVHIELPKNTVGMLKSKSGLNVKHGITSEGVIDCGYTGSICVKLYNHSNEDYLVREGDKISQLVVLPCISLKLEQAEELNESDRGTGGFGSTGR